MEVKFLAVHDFTKILLSFADRIDHRLCAIEKKQKEQSCVTNYNFTKLIDILVTGIQIFITIQNSNIKISTFSKKLAAMRNIKAKRSWTI